MQKHNAISAMPENISSLAPLISMFPAYSMTGMVPAAIFAGLAYIDGVTVNQMAMQNSRKVRGSDE